MLRALSFQGLGLCLATLALAGQARAQSSATGGTQSPAAPPPASPSTPVTPTEPLDPASLGDAGNAALDLFRGAAALGTVATCRTGTYGDDDPTVRGFQVEGELVDKADDVRALLESSLPWTKMGRPYNEESCDALRHVVDQLRYRGEVVETPVADGVSLTVKLAPQTLVRHIKVDGNLSVLGILGGDFRPIFATDIERRLSLQPGSPIADGPEERRLQLVAEEQRVVDYLSRRGHFDAEVQVVAKDDGPHEVTLDVKIDRGPTYTVGRVTTIWRSGDTQLTSQEALKLTGISDQRITEAVEQRLCPLFFCGPGRFSYEQLSEDRDKVRELLQKRGFPAVRVRIPYDPRVSIERATNTIRLTVEITLNKQLTVSFQGVENKSEEKLREVLTFNAANAVDDIEAEASAEGIRAAYQADGRFQTVVAFERSRLQPSESCPTCLAHDEIVFHVDEGPEQKIRGITFQGDKAIPKGTLDNVIITRVYPTLPFSSGGYVTSVQLEQDLGRIVTFYNALGFSHAQVTAKLGNQPDLVGEMGAVAAEVASDDGGSGLYIRFDVDEGAQDIIASVGFAGNHALTANELTRLSQLQVGHQYTESIVDGAVQRIKERYDVRGYPYVQIVRKIEGDGPEKRITLTLIEGQRATVGKILVRGNFKTANWVVLDNFELKTGDRMSADALERGRGNLRNAGLFTTVLSPTYPPADRPGRDPANLILEVGERYDRLADLDIGAGLSTDNSLFGSLTLAMRNLFGTGTTLTATGEVGLLRTAIQGSLVFPEWLMRRGTGLPVRFEIQGRYRVDQTPRFGSLTTLGGTLTVSKQLAKGVILSIKYDWNRFGRTTELLRPPGNDQEIPPVPIDTTTAILGPTLLVDKRDNPLSPSRGYFFSAQLGLASTALLGTDDFFKLDLAGQLFIPLGRRIVLTNSVRWDQGFPLGDAVLLPEVERFSAGGDTTVRGYETDRLATEVIRNPFSPVGSADAFRIVPIGKNIRVIHRLDFQLRLVDRLFQSVDIASALFLDTGLLTNSFADFEIDQIRQGIGMGIRVISAAGIISIEYAFPLQPRLGDDPTGRFHVVFGITI